MSITAAIVMFSVTWFMVFFMVLPVRFKSQGEAGTIVPGTPSSAPAEAHIALKAKITTAITAVIWLIMAGIITSGWITIRDIDVMGRLGPEPTAAQP